MSIELLQEIGRGFFSFSPFLLFHIYIGTYICTECIYLYICIYLPHKVTTNNGDIYKHHGKSPG
jgi:hypothetical protein